MGNNLILMIDDDENVKVVKLYLEKEGMDVLVANDGKSGVDLFNTSSPQLVLLDIMMPGMDGVEVLKRIRKESNVPVIMLTAKSDTFDKVLVLELGADDYIVKPFDPKELTAQIRAVVRRGEASAEEADDTIRFPRSGDINYNLYGGI